MAIARAWTNWTCPHCPNFHRSPDGLVRARFDATETRCVCEAVGTILPPDRGWHSGDLLVSVVEWRSGNIGRRRMVEEMLPGLQLCPAYQQRIRL